MFENSSWAPQPAPCKSSRNVAVVDVDALLWYKVMLKQSRWLEGQPLRLEECSC